MIWCEYAMSDESRTGEEPEEIDPKIRSRMSAQDAAGDLARMGIDPRSLGLDGADGPATPDAPLPADRRAESADAEDDPSASIVPLRPEFGSSGPVPPPAVAPQPAPASPPQRQFGPVEQMIAQTATRKPAPRSSSRVVKALTFGLLTPDAAEAAGSERELVGALRQRQTERRIIAFVSGKGGVGTTTVACAVGTAFAALRDDHTVLVDAQSGTPSLTGLHGLSEAMSGRELLTAEDEVGPVVTGAGLRLVDGAGWGRPLERNDLVGVLDRLGVDNAFTLVDAGRDPGEAAHTAVARCDQAVIVTPVGEMGMAALDVAVARLRQVNPLAAERAVYAVVCPYREAYRRAHREVLQRLAVEPARVVVIPPDETLKSGQVFDPAMAGAPTREAMLEIAAALAMSGGQR